MWIDQIVSDGPLLCCMPGSCLLVACGFEQGTRSVRGGERRLGGEGEGGGGELMEKYSKAPSEVRISSEGLLGVDDNLHVLLM